MYNNPIVVTEISARINTIFNGFNTFLGAPAGVNPIIDLSGANTYLLFKMYKVKNKAGNFVDASIKSVTSAANVTIPADARVSLTNTDAADGYPISSLTWILIYKDQNYDGRAIDKAKASSKLIWWMTHEGQKLAEPLNYAPLPTAAVKVAEANLKSLNFGGKPLL